MSFFVKNEVFSKAQFVLFYPPALRTKYFTHLEPLTRSSKAQFDWCTVPLSIRGVADTRLEKHLCQLALLSNFSRLK